MLAAKGTYLHSNSVPTPTTNDAMADAPFPGRQNRPNTMTGKKQAAYRLPDKAVRVTMLPGGRSAMSAVMSASRATSQRVRRMRAASDSAGRTNREHQAPAHCSLLTALVLLGRYGEAGEPQLDRFLRGIGAEVVAVGESQANLARDAALRFGRGRHPAGLNFGDCFSYALSMARDEPLLFVGDDFSQTDVKVSRW